MKTPKAILVAVLAIFCMAMLTGVAMSEEKVSIKGKVKSINLDARIVVVTTDDGKDVTINVEDEETLNKFKDGRISIDDDVKVKYVVKDGKNVATYFKKIAGC